MPAWGHEDLESLTTKEIRNLLEDKGITTQPNIGKRAVILLADRVARGPLDYTLCSRSELQTFLWQRKIFNVGRTHDLTARLEKADDERSFVRFQELPAELRNRIYSFATKRPWSSVLYDSYEQAAITRVSRSVRHDALPVFYQQTQFSLEVSRTNVDDETSTVDQRLESVWHWILSPEHVKLVTNITLWFTSDAPPAKINCIGIDVSLDVKSSTFNVSPSDGARLYNVSEMKTRNEWRNAASMRIKSVLEDLARNPGFGNLRATDFTRLAKCLNRPLQAVSQVDQSEAVFF